MGNVNMGFNTTCNSTLEHLKILEHSELPVVGSLTFHDLALIIAGGCAAIAILTSLYLIARHANNFTAPEEQMHIIRILFMVPVYSTAMFLALYYYWHAVYFQVLSDCYEAFAISSFFALMCAYVGKDVHKQKIYFQQAMAREFPIKPWVWPLSWFKRCCCGDRGPWRRPRSGLTWFNIIWIGVYQYCFIRVAMTITAVVTEHFEKYCESSNSPVFAHIWVLILVSLAVSIAMFCLVQFYVQLKDMPRVAIQRPFLKVLAIKLVIFLSFWQSTAISLGTSTLQIVQPNAVIAYPDLKVGVPSLLLCFEMSLFSILHLWAFPWKDYTVESRQRYLAEHPMPGKRDREDDFVENHGGHFGMRGLWKAVWIDDVIRAFARGVRWVFVDVHHREERDKTYQPDALGMDEMPYQIKGHSATDVHPSRRSAAINITAGIPVTDEFGATRYGKPARKRPDLYESAALMENAQPDPASSHALSPPRTPSRWKRGYAALDLEFPDAAELSQHHRQDGIRSATSPAWSRHASLSTVPEESRPSSTHDPNAPARGRHPRRIARSPRVEPASPD